MRMLVFQSSSRFETFGGIEYYLDDLLCSAAEVWPQSPPAALVPKRSRFTPLPRPYAVHPVQHSKNRLLSKLQNRFNVPLIRDALARVRATQPDFLVSGHVALGPVTWLLSRLTGIPYLSVVYGIESWGGLWAWDEFALRRSHGIISISQWTKDRLVARGYSADQIQILHPRLDSRLENLELPLRLPSTPLRLLSVSRLDANEQYKGHDHVLQALLILRSRAPELQFHYTIQGDGTDRARLEALVDEWALGDRVTFTLPVHDRVELSRAYENADLLVMPSRFGKWERRWRGEGFGIVYLEAAAFGVPSLAYDCGGVTDIIENGVTGILATPDDISRLADALAELARDPQNITLMGRNAHAAVNTRFTRTAVHAQLESAVREFSRQDRQMPTTSRSPQPSEAPQIPA